MTLSNAFGFGSSFLSRELFWLNQPKSGGREEKEHTVGNKIQNTYLTTYWHVPNLATSICLLQSQPLSTRGQRLVLMSMLRLRWRRRERQTRSLLVKAFTICAGNLYVGIWSGTWSGDDFYFCRKQELLCSCLMLISISLHLVVKIEVCLDSFLALDGHEREVLITVHWLLFAEISHT